MFGERRRTRGFGNRNRFGHGRRRRFGREIKPAPIKEGEEYDVKIKEVSNRGDGITRVKNFVVFVPGAKEGDEVRIRIKEVRRNHGVGEIVQTKEGKPIEGEEEPLYTKGMKDSFEQNIVGASGEAV